MLVATDFEKAFYSLDHTYLAQVLRAFNAGTSFIQWIRVFYSYISSCIINNGFPSDYFTIGRGMRQGDPLSPFLFILRLEILACSIRQNEQNKKMQGIWIRNVEVKVSLFADDLSCFLQDRSSYNFLQESIVNFSKCSNLNVNKEKTEFFGLGLSKLEYELFPHEFETCIWCAFRLQCD